MAWMLAACISSLLFLITVLGIFVPFQNADGVEYFFAAPPLTTVLIWWLPSVVSIAAAFTTVRRRARTTPPLLAAEAASGRWLAPLAAVGIVFLGVVPAIPGVGERGSIVGFALYDLRWWWGMALTALTVVRADRLVGAPLARAWHWFEGWSPAARLVVLEALMFFGVLTWALMTTSNPFDGWLVGDEPKYVRYGEAWYQGHGLDVSDLQLVSEQPLDARPPLLRNVTVLFGAIPKALGTAAQDLRDFSRDPAHFRWNRASAYNTFVTGIHGGVYQQYSPGMSVFLFPGYFVDRYLLNVESSRDGRWPADLTMTKTMMLLTYGFCAVMLFRLLRNALDSEILAWLWAAVAMLTLPMTAFAFQLYPELPALFVVLAVSNHLLFGNPTRSTSAAIAGAAAGALGWIHVRFLLIGLCFVAFGLVVKKGRARWVFVSASGAVVLSMMLFNYYVTGSWWPTALWDANGMGVSFGSVFLRNFVGYGFDRRWGLLPHSLVLAGALPGLMILGLRSRRQALFVTVVVAGLVIASAGHTLVGAATTPDRLILAVTPLLIWPVAVLVRHFWFLPAMRVVTAAFVVVSLDAGRAYNWVDAKGYGGLFRDASFSGWKPNLAFPDIRGESWDVSYANFWLLLGLAAVVVGAALLALRYASRSTPPVVAETRPARSSPSWRGGLYSRLAPAIAIGGLMIGFAVASSVNDDWANGPYLLDDPTARATAARAVVSRDICLCFTSARGHVDWSNLGPNSARSALIDFFPDDLRMTVLLLVQGDGQTPAFGRMRVEFGDGEQTPWAGVLAERRVEHVYRQSGTYQVRVWFQLPTRVAPQLHTQAVEVRSRL